MMRPLFEVKSVVHLKYLIVNRSQKDHLQFNQ